MMFWLEQFLQCVYIIIFNDVDENPGPTIYETVETTPFMLILVGEIKLYLVTMSLTATIFRYTIAISTWSSSDLSNIY